MLCEKCKLRDATVHLTEMHKNVKSEIHICELCARDFGLNNKISNFSLSLPDMLTFLDIDDLDSGNDTYVCATCGMNYLDYRKAGKLGCSNCYRDLKSTLNSIIYSYHGNKRHVGKVPENYIESASLNKTIPEFKKETINSISNNNLHMELKRAIGEERYEDAAVLRDKISGKEEGRGE